MEIIGQRPSIMRSFIATSCLISLALSNVTGHCAEQTATVAWLDLPPLVIGRELRARLQNGVSIRGRVTSLTPEAMLVHVEKTSDATVIPKGNQNLRRQLFSTLEIKWKKSGRSRAVLTPVMGLGGAGIGLLVVASEKSLRRRRQ